MTSITAQDASRAVHFLVAATAARQQELEQYGGSSYIADSDCDIDSFSPILDNLVVERISEAVHQITNFHFPEFSPI